MLRRPAGRRNGQGPTAPVMSDKTTDTFFGGQIQVRQPRAGYRFSIDAVLLANLASVGLRERVLELGTGCGIVSLILAHRFSTVSIQAIELQPQLVELARENVRANGSQSSKTTCGERRPKRYMGLSIWSCATPPTAGTVRAGSTPTPRKPSPATRSRPAWGMWFPQLDGC
jgi:hypothetical protein